MKIFRKHLGWYVEGAPWPASAADRRVAKSRLCRMQDPHAIEAALIALWIKQDWKHDEGRIDGMGVEERLADDRRTSEPDEALLRREGPGEAIVRLVLKATMASLEIKKPSGKWEKVTGEAYRRSSPTRIPACPAVWASPPSRVSPS